MRRNFKDLIGLSSLLVITLTGMTIGSVPAAAEGAMRDGGFIPPMPTKSQDFATRSADMMSILPFGDDSFRSADAGHGGCNPGDTSGDSCCWCAEWVRKELWNEQHSVLSDGVADAYQYHNNTRAMRLRGFRQSNVPVVGAVVVFGTNTRFFRKDTNKWYRAEGDQATYGHIGIVVGGIASHNGGKYHGFAMRSANWQFTVPIDGFSSGCGNVEDDHIAVYPNDVSYWVKNPAYQLTWKGDADENRKINALDYSLAITDYQTNAIRSDFNGDGVVNSIDVAIVGDSLGMGTSADTSNASSSDVQRLINRHLERRAVKRNSR